MLPYFFGTTDRQLFGAYYGPQTRATSHGVVLCAPMGHEYVNALRGWRQLAVRLARAGLHVLRFDYSGSGDSAGAGEGVDVSEWLTDIEVAIADLRERHGVAGVSLAGLRLGGTLATLVATGRCDVRSLVLWEPVVSGRAYLAELRNRQQAFLAGETAEGRDAASRSGPSEVMGFPLSAATSTFLERIDLRGISKPPAPKVLAIGNGDQTQTMVARLRSMCHHVDHRSMPGHNIWNRAVGEPRALVPQPVLEAIVNCLGPTGT